MSDHTEEQAEGRFEDWQERTQGGTYTNFPHDDLPDAEPGHDADFAGRHLDDPRINDLPDLMLTIPREWDVDILELSNET